MENGNGLNRIAAPKHSHVVPFDANQLKTIQAAHAQFLQVVQVVASCMGLSGVPVSIASDMSGFVIEEGESR